MKKAIVFDLDGTLLDSSGGLANSLNFVLRQFGFAEISRRDVVRFTGNGSRMLVERSLPGGKACPHFEEILSAYLDRYSSHSSEGTAPYPGIKELVAELVRRSMPMAVATNKDEYIAKDLLEHFFPGTFLVKGGGDGHPKKPDPRGVLEACSEFGISPNESLYVGDTSVDAETATAAGMPFVLCSWGFRPREELELLGTVIDNPAQILDFLDYPQV